MQLTQLLDHVPDHSIIGIVEEKNNRFTTVYSGHKCNFESFVEHGACINPIDYKVTTVHAGHWDNRFGLVVGVIRE